ncbi:hypothetical protein HCD_00215 [Helicobacter cetorum MIT 99-5656]|uniref:Uncharacterized protein n=1 Tax=Helicobacter cetorum (strain ATCC BAA-540 / CCUG 52418 / MIT 99-5656) TaxID=1163745 RepID=I0EQ56_HELCM|nr:hypothetical protein HCD_00215 [Helicobacter cetorum MIT 99-5656]
MRIKKPHLNHTQAHVSCVLGRFGTLKQVFLCDSIIKMPPLQAKNFVFSSRHDTTQKELIRQDETINQRQNQQHKT